ncbi:MAG TPA: hypothetical protein VF173_02095 [Thermoanaerobaculia bacterium]|nr:hypothetical protein [Thermoanaerobaculia bacterium]
MRNSRFLILAFVFALLAGMAPNELSAGTGLSYSQMTQYLSSYFSLEKSTPVNGQPRYMGATGDKLAMLELIGDKNDLTEATLIIGLPNDSQSVLVRNSAMFMRFIKNAAPSWEGSGDWAVAALKKATTTEVPVSTVRGTRRITVSLQKPLAMVLVTVKHR